MPVTKEDVTPDALQGPPTNEIAPEEEKKPAFTPAETQEAEEAEEAATDETPERIDEPPEIEGEEDLSAQIAELKRLKEEAAQEADRLAKLRRKARADFFTQESERPAESAAEAQPAAAMPKEENYNTFEEYQDALMDWKVDQRVSAYVRSQAQDRNRQQFERWKADTITEGRQKFTDFSEVAEDPTLPITPAILKALQDSDNAADVLYYLGRNPVETATIARMNPTAAARELGKIEVRITDGATQQPKPKPKKVVSNAPPPIKPSGTSTVVTKNPENMTLAEYEEWRRSGGGKI
jgi:hypothetical protein